MVKSTKTYTIVCKYCGEANLRWEIINGKWIMQNCHGEIHLCKGHTPVASHTPKFFEGE